MLRQRVLTAFVLGSFVILAVMLLSTLYVAILLGLILLVAAIEWSRLAGVSSNAGRTTFLLMVIAIMAGVTFGLKNQAGTPELLGAVSIGWVVLGIGLWQQRLRSPPPKAPGSQLKRLLAGLFVLIPAWLAVVYLHARFAAGPSLVLYLLILVWVVDSAAFFVGRRWGWHKLAPGISPAKTMEGVLGGVLGASVLGMLWSMWLGLGAAGGFGFVGISMLTAMISVVGDLFESWMKRSSGVKDSGSILPGHGGWLDRIDSLTAAAPFFATCVLHLGFVE